MTRGELDLFLSVVAALCGGMSVLNIVLVKRRGTTALVLSAAFLVLGFSIFAYRSQGVSTGVIAGGVIVIALLIVDFVLRAGNAERKRNP